MRTPFRTIKGDKSSWNNVKVFVLEDESDLATAQEAVDYIKDWNIAFIKVQGLDYIFTPQWLETASAPVLIYQFYALQSSTAGMVFGEVWISFISVEFYAEDDIVKSIHIYNGPNETIHPFTLAVGTWLPATPDANTLYFITGS